MLREVPTFKYLGLTLDYQLDFEAAVKHTTQAFWHSHSQVRDVLTLKLTNYTVETTSTLSSGHLPTIHMEPYPRAQTRPTHQHLTCSIHFLPKQTACTKPYALNSIDTMIKAATILVYAH